MPIHEKSLIEPERLLTADKLVIDGVDVSGHWNTMILPRYVTDYDTGFQDLIRSYAGGENAHRCWQCGSCTNSCTIHAIEPDFNPRYWIYLVSLGLKDELLRDKSIIWKCVSCNKCTNICPKDVRPEGVMKAIQHWLEDGGHVPASPSTRFDAEFTRQCIERGRIEDGEVLLNFLRDTRQSVVELFLRGWLGVFVQRMGNLHLLKAGRINDFLSRMPVIGPVKMALSLLRKPRTSDWSRTGMVLGRYVEERQAAARTARARHAA